MAGVGRGGFQVSRLSTTCSAFSRAGQGGPERCRDPKPKSTTLWTESMGDIGQEEDGVKGQKTPVTPQGATASYHPPARCWDLESPGPSWTVGPR